jgi:hypothetical protein
MKVSGQLNTPATLPLRKESPLPIGKEAGWATELVWMLWSGQKSLAPARNQTLAIQPVTRCNTDGAILAYEYGKYTNMKQRKS